MGAGKLPRSSDHRLEWDTWSTPAREDLLTAGSFNERNSLELSEDPALIGPSVDLQGITKNAAQKPASENALSAIQIRAGADKLNMTIAEFVERKFVPEHVALKGVSGRNHYQAMLKHVLTPEEVERIFQVISNESRKRLKSDPNWPYLNYVRLCDAHPDHINNLISVAIERGYSTQTAKLIRNVVSAVFSHAIKERCFKGNNPASQVKLPGLTRSTTSSLTIAQAAGALRMMKYPEKHMLLTAILTGMNTSEICGLKWKHVNLTTMEIDSEGEPIPQLSIAVRNRWYRGGLSSVKESRNRNLAIPPSLLQVLTKLSNRRRFTGPEDFVFVSRKGTPVNEANVVTRRLKPIAKHLGVQSLTWQVFYRTRNALAAELEKYFQIAKANMERQASPGDKPPSLV